mmetsp:Transcript_35766/g.86522  ORF Transcript_35766/g.86522 Transcript_35766/m.86522 type:complete len:425 (-) Transcript_35766:3-1277(-)
MHDGVGTRPETRRVEKRQKTSNINQEYSFVASEDQEYSFTVLDSSTVLAKRGSFFWWRNFGRFMWERASNVDSFDCFYKHQNLDPEDPNFDDAQARIITALTAIAKWAKHTKAVIITMVVSASHNGQGRTFSLTPEVSQLGASSWAPLVEDEATQSFAYYYDYDDSSNDDKGTSPAFASQADLDRWFRELHPSNYEARQDEISWTGASYKGEVLLRKTAWCVFDDECKCEYGYSDTWQPIAQSAKMKKVIAEITEAINRAVLGNDNGNQTTPPAFDCCNLNYYPKGGGVGFHADDEFLFDGLCRPVRIVSLSLTSPSSEESGCGARKFQVRRKRDDEDGNTAHEKYNHDAIEVMLKHGDIMTMEGYFQKHYLHSVWPGDSKEYMDHPHTQGERINLTWRTIVQHLDGSQDCMGKVCPLSATTAK